MSAIVLSNRGAKLMKLCEIAGFRTFGQLRQLAITGNSCPAICMTEGCDHITETEPGQDHGHCETCGGDSVTSVLVLAELKRGSDKSQCAEESEHE